LKLGGIDTSLVGATFFPDGKRILVEGRQLGRPFRCYVQDIDGGPPRPITPEGIHSQVISPDGRFLAALDPERRILLYPVGGGAPIAASGSTEPGDLNVWSADGRSIYVTEANEVVLVKVFRRDLASGRRELLKEITPSDPAGIFSLRPAIARDGGSYVYGYSRVLGNLYLVQGLK
jgi:Tol biopolymer transport system component